MKLPVSRIPSFPNLTIKRQDHEKGDGKQFKEGYKMLSPACQFPTSSGSSLSNQIKAMA